MFEKFTQIEKGKIVGEKELKQIISTKQITLTTFSCLSGEPDQLPENLGKFFTSGKDKVVTRLLTSLESSIAITLRVIIDDTDPVRIWGSTLHQADITEWLRMIIEDVPMRENIEIVLWSDLEKQGSQSFYQILETIRTPKHALLIYHRLQHMKQRPPRRLFGSLQEASERRVAQFALQGKVFEATTPNAVLIQTDSPWKVKDPPYQALRQTLLPIIHPFSEIK